MIHVIDAAADAAFDRYAELLSQQAVAPGQQLDIFAAIDAAHAREWHDIWIACERAAVSS